MDPHLNAALNDAKLQSVLKSFISTLRTSDSTRNEDMPAPPAYHSIVDPTAPIPNMHNPYHPEEEDDKDDCETPEITINAATQVRGNGNIISITQMDSVRIANLIAIMLHGEKVHEPANLQPQPQPHSLPPLANLTAQPKSMRQYPKMNITVNCGATVIGDRNIVGPGLGDIARQMQIAQRNAALQAQQQAQAKGTAPSIPNGETLYQAQASIAQHHGFFAGQTPTPPMSRSSSLQSDGVGGVKRKAEDDVKDGVAKRQC